MRLEGVGAFVIQAAGTVDIALPTRKEVRPPTGGPHLPEENAVRTSSASFGLISLLVTLVTACSEDTVTPPPPVATVTVDPSTVVLDVAETRSLAVTLRDAGGAQLSGRRVDFLSANPAIVSVDAAGVVTGVSPGGPVSVTVRSEGQSAAASVSVRFPGFSTMSTGTSHSCGLIKEDAFCWGGNEVGQLGDGTTQDRGIAGRVLGGLRFSSLALAHFHACGLTTTGEAHCWGYGAWGQRGDGSTTRTRTTPTPVVGGHRFTMLVAGGDYFNAAPLFVLDDAHVCGLTAAGTAMCWGSNRWGELGTGVQSSGSSIPQPVVGAPPLVAIEAGAFHNCGLTAAGDAHCWGYNAQGQLGRPGGTGSFSARAVPVSGGVRLASLAVGDAHSCGLTTSGSAYCWGYNLWGQLGDGTTTERSTPTLVAGPAGPFRALVAGERHTCALTLSDEAFCWGSNAIGQLGDGTSSSSSPIPVRVAGGHKFSSLFSDDFHTCATSLDGRNYCWGANSRGQLGDGTTSTARQPVPVLLPGRSSLLGRPTTPARLSPETNVSKLTCSSLGLPPSADDRGLQLGCSLVETGRACLAQKLSAAGRSPKPCVGE
jgi:alpha-tubulin suppressor-like RCC1 family protein